MKEKLNGMGLSPFKVALTSALCLSGLFSIIYVALTDNELYGYFYCVATFAFVALPLVMTLLFRWKMNLLFYILFTLYTFGPLLGGVYRLYYFIPWWDIFLHFLAGTIFAVVGARLAYVMNKNNNTSYIFAAVFGVLLSVGIAVAWEIFEYGCDTFLYSDMQSDTIITAINTKINRTDGIADRFTDIAETLVNGESLGVNGYLDIGLNDTMEDMIVETAGALFFFIYVLLDKNAHPMIAALPKGEDLPIKKQKTDI